jgi:hypothetical protein
VKDLPLNSNDKFVGIFLVRASVQILGDDPERKVRGRDLGLDLSRFCFHNRMIRTDEYEQDGRKTPVSI